MIKAKVPGERAVFLHVPLAESPELTTEALTCAQERIYSRPYHIPLKEIEAKERAHIKQGSKAKLVEDDVFIPEEVWEDE
jgi:hypothetical protein